MFNSTYNALLIRPGSGNEKRQIIHEGQSIQHPTDEVGICGDVVSAGPAHALLFLCAKSAYRIAVRS